MALMNEDDDTLDTGESAGPSAVADTAGYISRSAKNPYTKDLSDLLKKYLQQTDRQATDKERLLNEARERILKRSMGPEDSEVAFRIAAALGKPTRTGHFSEGLANVSEATAGILGERRKARQELEDLDLKYRMAGLDVKSEGMKTKIEALSTLARSVPKERVPEIMAMQEILDDPNATEAAKKTAKARIDYLTTRGGQKVGEIDQLIAKINDPNTPPAAKRMYQARYNKLVHIPPSGTETTASKPQSPQGKIAADEGLTPGTTEYNTRVKDLVKQGQNKLSPTELKMQDELKDKIVAGKEVILTLNKALQLNPVAYEGSTAGAREVAGRLVPLVRSSEAQTATAELENLILSNALSQLKVIFGAAPTEGERKILVDLQGSINKPLKTRETIWKNAQKAASRRLEDNQKRLQDLTTGASARRASEEPDGMADGGPVKKKGSKAQKKSDLPPLPPIDPTEEDLKAYRAEVKDYDNRQYWFNRGRNSADEATFNKTLDEFTYAMPFDLPVHLDENSMFQIPMTNMEQIEARQKGRYYADGGPVKMREGGEFSAANIGRSVGLGLGFGFGDEAVARVRAKMEGRPYEDVLREERESYKRFSEKYPLTALGTELVSGAVPTVAAMFIPGTQAASVVGGARMAQAAQKFGSVLPKFMTGQAGKLAGVGGVTGAVSGAGTATEGERGTGAVTGGLTGAVAGPVVAKGVDLGVRGGKALKNVFSPSGQTVEDRATMKVLEAMSRDEMTPADVRAKMIADQKMGVKPMMMDVTPSTKTLGEAVVTLPGKGRKILGTPLEERLEQGRDVVGQRTSQTLAKGQDFTATEDSLVGRLRANANNMYDKAYAHGSVDDTRLLTVLEDDTFKDAFKEAQRIANKEARAAELRGEDPSKFKLNDIYNLDDQGNMVSVGKIPDVRTLDYIKRGIDALIDKGYQGKGMAKAEANALKDLRKAFVGVIDENVPEYAAARAKYAGDMEVLDALRLGKDEYLTPKMLPEQARKLVSGMSDAEKDALRIGAAQSIMTKIMDAPQQINAAQRVIGAPATRKRLEALFDNPAEYQVFEAALKREAELFRNAQEVIRNSRTANKKEAIDDLKRSTNILDVAGEAVNVASGTPGNVVGRVLKYLQARSSLDEKTAAEVANMLKSGTPSEIDSVLTRLEKSAGEFTRQQERTANRMKAISGAVGTAGPEEGPVPPAPPPEPVIPEEDDETKIQRILQENRNG